eukprot:3592697-Rhodomonas_salina.2
MDSKGTVLRKRKRRRRDSQGVVLRKRRRRGTAKVLLRGGGGEGQQGCGVKEEEEEERDLKVCLGREPHTAGDPDSQTLTSLTCCAESVRQHDRSMNGHWRWVT